MKKEITIEEIKEYSENDLVLEELLITCLNNNIKTLFSCSGHNKILKEAYVTIELDENNLYLISNTMNLLKSNNSIRYNFSKKLETNKIQFSIYIKKIKSRHIVMKQLIEEFKINYKKESNLVKTDEAIINLVEVLKNEECSFNMYYKKGISNKLLIQSLVSNNLSKDSKEKLFEDYKFKLENPTKGIEIFHKKFLKKEEEIKFYKQVSNLLVEKNNYNESINNDEIKNNLSKEKENKEVIQPNVIFRSKEIPTNQIIGLIEKLCLELNDILNQSPLENNIKYLEFKTDIFKNFEMLNIKNIYINTIENNLNAIEEYIKTNNIEIDIETLIINTKSNQNDMNQKK